MSVRNTISFFLFPESMLLVIQIENTSRVYDLLISVVSKQHIMCRVNNFMFKSASILPCRTEMNRIHVGICFYCCIISD